MTLTAKLFITGCLMLFAAISCHGLAISTGTITKATVLTGRAALAFYALSFLLIVAAVWSHK